MGRRISVGGSRRALALILRCCLVAITSIVRSAPGAELPIPPAVQIDRAQQFVHGIYKNDFAQHSRPERLDLAQRLLKGAADAPDDAAMRYVMRTEARDLAAMGGDLKLMHRAIDELTGEFSVDPLQMIADGLTAAPRGGNRTGGESEQIAGAWIDVLDRAMAARNFELANKASTGAEAGLRLVKDKVRAERIKIQVKEAREGAQLEDAAGPARLVLSTHPDDPAANLTVGKYVCFIKNSWTEGLPYLAKGSKEDSLKKVIDQDLAAPKVTAAQVALADGWLEFANAQPDGMARSGYRSRAAFWYAMAQPKSAGLVKAKIKLRLAELPALDPALIAAVKPAEPEEKPGYKKIVYICDGRGAMIDVLGETRRQIKKAVGDLKDSQSFTVMVAQETGVAAMSNKLLDATTERKDSVARFLISHPCGGVSTPMPSLSAALDLKPDVIWFFTSGDFPDTGAVARELSKLNRDRVPVNFTVVSETFTASDFPGLAKLARDNHGELRVVK